MADNLQTTYGVDPAHPSDSDVSQVLAQVERTSHSDSPQGPAMPAAAPEQPSASETAPNVAFIFLAILFLCCLVIVARHLSKTLPAASSRQSATTTPPSPVVDSALQADAERLLAHAVSGDRSSADQILEQSDSWTGKTHRTPQTEQLMGTGINSPDLRVRAATLRAQLALDGITRDAIGLARLTQAADDPRNRAWALYSLGELGASGVDPDQAAKVIEAYIADPSVQVRSNAVMGLAFIATDETVPMLLDRLRNDPSPVVQDLAACGIADSGLYTHQQRVMAASTLITWLDDSLVNQQQRIWITQALTEISGQSHGTDSAEWRRWYESAR